MYLGSQMELGMSYYHILIEVNDHISTIEQTRDIELFNRPLAKVKTTSI